MRKWAFLLVLASCTSFGSDPGPGASVDGGSAPDAPSDAALPDGSLSGEAGTPPTGKYAEWVTGSGDAVTCPGESQPRMLATDPENCGRCGYSCNGSACQAGHCKDRDELVGGQLLGAGPMGAILHRDQDRTVVKLPLSGQLDPLVPSIAQGASAPVAAIAWGDRTYVRTGDSVVPYPPVGTTIPYESGPPTVAATDAGLFVPGNSGRVLRFPHDTLLGPAEIAVPGIREIAAAEGEPVAIQASPGNAASLAKVGDLGGLVQLVGDAGNARSLVAYGRDAFYADGKSLMRVSLDGGAPEVLVRATGDIAAYVGRPAVAVTERNVFFVVSLGTNDNYQVMALERGCESPTPRRVAFAQNLAGIAANATHLFYVANSDTVRSQRIASNR